jgi:signal transduction histidine kinase
VKGINRVYGRRKWSGTIRTRVLAIVLVPSAALLLIGAGGSGYLVNQGVEAQHWAELLQGAISPAIDFTTTIQEERRLSLLRLNGDQQNSAALEEQRQKVNGALAEINGLAPTLLELNPDAVGDAASAFYQLFAQIPVMRQRIDAYQVGSGDAYAFYNQLVSVISIGLQDVGRHAPESPVAADETTATDLFQVTDAMSRGNALGAGAVARGGLSADERIEYAHEIGTYHLLLQNLVTRLPDHGKQQYGALVAGDAWKQLSAQENAVMLGSNRLPMSLPDWQNAAVQVTSGLLGIWIDFHRTAQEAAADGGHTTFVQSLIAGIVLLIIAIIAFLIAARMANRLVRRLKRLREDTLDLADERLPRVVERVRSGERLDLDTEIAPLDHGSDEIGEVADAFDKAQHTAISAAVSEAKTRKGVNAVFLNIAHRSQVVVHRQLEVLDQAERRQEDPEQLEVLFKLDHLATRSRRNAENLIILGGSQPGRQWRNPVPLVEVVRSAIGETEDYARVRTGRLPAVSMVGVVVADLVHLLAELIDNAASFSPPESQVEIRGNVVGRGVVIEIEDQGLGIIAEERDRLNDSLHDAPDFEVMSLSTESRLGLFVVARLAARHGIGITLAESAYGGTRAIALLRSPLLAPLDENGDDSNGGGSGRTGSEDTVISAPPQRTGDRAPFEPWRHPAEPPLPWTAPREPVAGNGAAASTLWPDHEPTEVTRGTEHAPWQRSREMPPERSVERSMPGVARHTRPGSGDDTRPPLPRRRRQTSLAPQLATDAGGERGEPRPETADDEWSAERARDTMAAFQRGTFRARDED